VSAAEASLPAEAPLLELRGVHAAYGSIEVLHGIDLAVPGGSILAILGPNGAGKTTALKVMSGIMRPTRGSLLLEGQDVTGVSAEQLARIGLCLIPEGRGIFPNLTVRENLLMDTFAAGGRRPAELEEVAFARFPRLAERRHQVAGTLSGGEQQMLALSRALATDPALILLDELSMGLAPKIVEELFEIVRQLADTGVTTVVVEQFAGVVLEFADQVALVTHGRVRARGPADEIRDALAGAYLGGGS
jgi:branched-chain amino acid transport system ATP-binding protein